MKKKNIILLFMLLISTATGFAGGTREAPTGPDGGKLQLVTTTSIITDVVENIAGDHAVVTGLIPRGQDPHGYEPKPRQIAAVEKADIVFVNGFDLEEQILEIVKKNAGGSLVEVSHGIIPLTADAETGDHHHDADPHTWMSVRNVMTWVSNIEKALSAADPANISDYKAGAGAYIEKLDALDKEISAEFSAVPEEKKIVLTDHEVFGYMARDYGFAVIGTILPSFSTNSEASARHLTDLVGIIRKNRINAMFIGVSSGDAVNELAATLSRESGRTVEIFSILTGSLAPAGSEGDTYLGFFRYNAEQILKGLKN